jgi:hypothetical protein
MRFYLELQLINGALARLIDCLVTLDWHLIVNQGGAPDLTHPSYSVAQPITEF